MRLVGLSVKLGLAALGLGLCLFGECLVVREGGTLRCLLGEIEAAMKDPCTQWMVSACAGAYFLAFAAIRVRLAGGAGVREGGGAHADSGLAMEWLREPALWLSGLMAVAIVGYALSYSQAVKSAQALTLLGAAVLGQGAALWESRKRKVESRNGGSRTVGVLIVLLALAAVWQAEVGHVFQYRGQGRWAGPWDNPNTFGVLMGVGFVLAIGRLVSRKAESRKLKAEMGGDSGKAESRKLKAEIAREHPTSNNQHSTSSWGRWLVGAVLLAAAGAMGVGLVRSYSRGAWLGAAVGLAYLAHQMLKSEKLKAEILKGVRRRGALAVICASIAVLGFWSFREAEGLVARRAYSVASANDFSWRNRVAAYEGALQMMAEKPWFGFGWNQPERVYGGYYRAAKVDEGAAIQLNDYLMLGMTLGVPALVCFLAYVALALTGSARKASGTSNIEHRTPNLEHRTLAFSLQPLALPAVCRAGAMVLLVGFWFDGGLFKLATGATFWVLLELGREERQAAENVASRQ